MDVQEYIESGILERYVLGNTLEQERKEVECMSHIYPEIKVALDELQESVNKYATLYEKAPPTALKGKIMTELDELKKNENKESAKVITLPENATEHKSASNIYKWVAAASVILFLIMGWLYNDTHNKLSTSQNETIVLAEELQQQKELASAQIEGVKKQNEQLNEGIALLNNPENKVINMATVAKDAPTAHATICWNNRTKEVYIGFANLPIPPANKQYQLWAIANGKPIDLGVIDKNKPVSVVQKMKTTERAQAFAVTLEKVGGSPSPTLAAMYVMGGV